MQESNRSAVTLVLGGVRSGKSSYAQNLANLMNRVVFIATGSASDEEMQERIDKHRSDRPSHWQTIEEQLDLALAIGSVPFDTEMIIVDCLTVYAGTLLEKTGDNPADIESRINQLCHALSTIRCPIVLVSNEVGSGVVPPYPLGRRYRDLLGEINQRVARVANIVVLMVAGLPLYLKPQSSQALETR